MISNNLGSFGVIDPFLKFKEFEYGKKDKTKHKENFNSNKSPKQKGSSHWLEPKEILYEKGEQEIKQTQTNEENNSSNELVSVKLPDKKF